MKQGLTRRLLVRAVLAAVLIVAGAAGLGSGAAAGDAATLSRELVEIMGMTMTVDRIEVTVSDELSGPVDPALPDADARASEIGREMFADKLMPVFDAMAASVESVLMARFTVAELGELLAFYRSEAGRKTITLMPEVRAAIENALQSGIGAAAQRVLPVVMDRMRAEGYPLSDENAD